MFGLQDFGASVRLGPLRIGVLLLGSSGCRGGVSPLVGLWSPGCWAETCDLQGKQA